MYDKALTVVRERRKKKKTYVGNNVKLSYQLLIWHIQDSGACISEHRVYILR